MLFKFSKKYFLLILILLIPSTFLFAAMQSSGYKIQTDSINIGGGRGNSTNFIEEDTIGEIGTGYSTSTSYATNSGYQATLANYIAITNAANVTLPNLGGISGGNSVGSSAWSVTTDDQAGYQLTISASTNPALISTSTNASLANYIKSITTTADYIFTVAPSTSVFGFTPEGTDIIQY